MRAIEVFDEACVTVGEVVDRAAGADLSRPTPCGWSLQTLVNHFAGTTGALARVGRREPLEPDHPWGSENEATGPEWASILRDRLTALSASWSRPEAWQGSAVASGSQMPAESLAEMALVEVVLHGWDLARTTGQVIDLSPALAREVHRSVSETAEIGRSMGAYGPEVEVCAEAGVFERALGAAGRDPAWQP